MNVEDCKYYQQKCRRCCMHSEQLQDCTRGNNNIEMYADIQCSPQVFGHWYNFCSFGPVLQHIGFEIKHMNN